MMNQTIKQRWIEALRSGEYQQTTGGLHSEQGFCCLGVLTDLYLKEHDGDWIPGDTTNDVLNYHAYREYNYLSFPVGDWAGLGRGNPMIVMQNGEQDFLAHLNDSGKSFKEIADLIEEHL